MAPWLLQVWYDLQLRYLPSSGSFVLLLLPVVECMLPCHQYCELHSFCLQIGHTEGLDEDTPLEQPSVSVLYWKSTPLRWFGSLAD